MGTSKCFWKPWKETNRHRQIVLLPRKKLNNVGKIISKALVQSDISRAEFMQVINKEQNSFRLKEIIKGKDDEVHNIEHNKWLGSGKRIGENERQCLKLYTDI